MAGEIILLEGIEIGPIHDDALSLLPRRRDAKGKIFIVLGVHRQEFPVVMGRLEPVVGPRDRRRGGATKDAKTHNNAENEVSQLGLPVSSKFWSWASMSATIA